jgi:hypothetical protein
MLRSLVKAVLVVFILLVAVPSSHAAGVREEARSSRSGSFELLSWGFWTDLWEVLWNDNGCWLDPNGACRR